MITHHGFKQRWVVFEEWGAGGGLSLLTSVIVSKEEDQAKFAATDLKSKKVCK